ncbi:VOC family protein [Prevotella sp. 10(H)]|uniref:VOC family protein n=1 Tax=Prevotella sp. 10(H) TaxID=1158294 RepID=UPI0004A72D35|nr:VOC family protein [Prevotella sp. 10(H)]
MATTVNPVVWFEIYVSDIDRARNFYETVLEKKLSDMPMENSTDFKMVTFPYAEDQNAPNAPGALVWMKDMDAGANSTVVYFGCDDCAVEESRVRSAGGEIHKSKFSIGEHGFISLCVDTEGNIFGLHSMK